MNEMNKEVLHRMCDKIKLSDTQKEGIMRKINEEVSEKKHRSFNVRRFATVMASVLVLVGATVVVEAKFSIVDKISALYTAWQTEDVVLNEEEKEILESMSIDIGYEFEVEGGKVKIDGIMYDSSFIYLLYTSTADDGNHDLVNRLFTGGLRFIIKGKEYAGNFGGFGNTEDMEEEKDGFQGCYVFCVSPFQTVSGPNYSGSREVINFSFSQGDEIILTDKEFVSKEFRRSHSMDDIEKIYGTFTLENSTNTLVFNYGNTEGMKILETITEIKLSPISIMVVGDKFLRKTFPEGIGYQYIERGDKVFTIGLTGDKEIDDTEMGYAFSVVKKDGSIAKYGTMGCSDSGIRSNMEYEYFYEQRTFEKPLDLSEVDYILIRGWGLEYKIPVNVEQ